MENDIFQSSSFGFWAQYNWAKPSDYNAGLNILELYNISTGPIHQK